MYVEAAALGLFGREPYVTVVREANERWVAALADHLVGAGAERRAARRAVDLVDAAFMGLQLDLPLAPDDPDQGRVVRDLADAVAAICCVRAGRRSRPRPDQQPVGEQAVEAAVALDRVGPGRVQPAAVHRPVGLADHRQQPAAALPVGAGPGLHLAGAARRTPGGRPRARRTGRRPGSVAPRVAAVQTSAPSSITATDQVAAVASSSGSSAVASVALGLGDRGGRELRARQRRAEHAADVGVEHGVAAAERERRDRRGGVVADARQREQVVVGRGHLAAVALDDRGRGGVQPERPARVAEPAPGPDRLARRLRPRGRPGVGQLLEPARRTPAAPARPASAGA